MKNPELRNKLVEIICEHPEGVTTVDLCRLLPEYHRQAIFACCKDIYIYSDKICCRGVVTHTPYGQFRRATLILLYAP